MRIKKLGNSIRKNHPYDKFAKVLDKIVDNINNGTNNRIEPLKYDDFTNSTINKKFITAINDIINNTPKLLSIQQFRSNKDKLVAQKINECIQKKESYIEAIYVIPTAGTYTILGDDQCLSYIECIQIGDLKTKAILEHTFDTPGEYKIKIIFKSGPVDLYILFLDVTCIKSVDFKNFRSPLKYNDSIQWLFGCRDINADNTLIAIKNFRNVFRKNQTSLKTCFQNRTALKYVDLSKFRINVSKLSFCFRNCKQLLTIDLRRINTKNVSEFDQMFYKCDNLNQIKGVSEFDVHNATTFDYMFANCRKLRKLNLKNWNAPICNTCKQMFNEAYNESSTVPYGTDLKGLTYLNLKNLFINNKVCVDLRDMFLGNPSLEAIEGLSNWLYGDGALLRSMFNFAYDGLNKYDYTKYYHIDHLATTIALPPIKKNSDSSNILRRQHFIETITECGKISASVSTAYGGVVEDAISLTRESILKLIDALDPENPGTLTLCPQNYEKLTEEDILIAIDKGWTIAH